MENRPGYVYILSFGGCWYDILTSVSLIKASCAHHLIYILEYNTSTPNYQFPASMWISNPFFISIHPHLFILVTYPLAMDDYYWCDWVTCLVSHKMKIFTAFWIRTGREIRSGGWLRGPIKTREGRTTQKLTTPKKKKKKIKRSITANATVKIGRRNPHFDRFYGIFWKYIFRIKLN